MISGVHKETIDKVVGLELGADVYITKPFDTIELSAQVKALIRRLRVQDQPEIAGWDFEDGDLINRLGGSCGAWNLDAREEHTSCYPEVVSMPAGYG